MWMGDHNRVRERSMLAWIYCIVRIHLAIAIVINFAVFSKIFAEDVNFFSYLKVDYLEAACKTSDIHKPYPYAYPPRFVLEVSARYAKQYSTIELTFTGARRDLYTEIQLHPLRCKSQFITELAIQTTIIIILLLSLLKVKMI